MPFVPWRRSAVLPLTASGAFQEIHQGLEEQQEIINKLKRYEDMIYCIAARRLSFLKHELAAIFGIFPKA